MFWYTNLRFFTNFTFHTHLKQQYSVSLTFLIRNWSGIVGFNQKRADFSKIPCFCKTCVAESQMPRFTRSAVHNPHFQFLYFTENASHCIIFSITEHIFYPTHVVLIPQAPFFFTCLLVHKSLFLTNFTFHTHLKRQYSVSLTFWVRNRLGIVGFNKKRTILFKISISFKKNVTEFKLSRSTHSVVHNPHFHDFRCSKSVSVH